MTSSKGYANFHSSRDAAPIRATAKKIAAEHREKQLLGRDAGTPVVIAV
jgi:hypothetical protein